MRPLFEKNGSTNCTCICASLFLNGFLSLRNGISKDENSETPSSNGNYSFCRFFRLSDLECLFNSLKPTKTQIGRDSEESSKWYELHDL